MEKIDYMGIRYRVVLLTDANFSPISLLNQLTEKQREVLIAAHKMGYYDIPRRITSQELGKKKTWPRGFHGCGTFKKSRVTPDDTDTRAITLFLSVL